LAQQRRLREIAFWLLIVEFANLMKIMKNFALLPASKEIREWCSILEQEMMHWTGVKMSHIFGTRAFYHRKVMFAMLPDQRSLDSSTAISFRAPLGGSNEDPGWQSFELSGPYLLDTALSLLDEAYRESVAHPFPKNTVS
jgi:hypothetical protein